MFFYLKENQDSCCKYECRL